MATIRPARYVPPNKRKQSVDDSKRRQELAKKEEKLSVDVADFSCSICLEIPNNAMETSCCHHLFCDGCIRQVLQNSCPQCRRQFQIVPSIFARRIIDKLPIECPHDGCNTVVNRSDLSNHQEKCDYKVFKCPSTNCQFSGIKQQFGQHLVDAHLNDLVNNAADLFNKKRNCGLLDSIVLPVDNDDDFYS